jgi:hypothetical protein
MFRYMFTRRLTVALMVMVSVCTLFWACSGEPSRAQTESKDGQLNRGANEDIQRVNEFLNTFQSRYSSRDFDGLTDLFMKGGSVVVDFEGEVRRYSTREWLALTKNIFERYSNLSDRLTEREIAVYRNIAVVLCRYDFDGPMEHSTGYDIFSLVRHDDSWLIVSLLYSGDRR